MNVQPLSIPFGSTTLWGDMIGEAPSVLCLHGAGQSDRHIYDRLRAYLAEERSIGSVTFDFIGHGETGGDIKSSSLQERTDQAVAVIEATKLVQPLSIIAGSMSGYAAVRLTELFPIAKLVLFVPAAYAADAYQLRFNDGFSERIRQLDSWRDSDAFRILGEFSGKALIIEAGQDAVIPVDLIDELMASAQHPQRLTVTAAPHLIRHYLRRHPDEERSVYATIADFLTD